MGRDVEVVILFADVVAVRNFTINSVMIRPEK